MRCNPLRWLLLGLILVPALTYIAVQFRYQHIQDDLHFRSQQALKQAGLPWGGTAYEGRDGLLSGRALEERDRRKAQTIVGNIWGVHRLDDTTNLIDKEDNYVWSAVLRKNRVKLVGFVPNSASRRSILSITKANFPGRKIKDSMRYARGVPSRDIWMGGISFSLQQLAKLKSGKSILSGLDLSLSGEARDFASYRSVKSAMANGLPKDVKLTRDEVHPPTVADYEWRAIYKGKKLVLSGHVPSEAIRARIFTTAKKKFPKVTIVDRMETALGNPNRWSEAVDLGLAQLAQLNSGSVLLTNSEMAFSGVAETEPLARTLDRTLVRRLPRKFRSVRKIKFIRPAIQVVKPFTTAIYLDKDLVILDGYVPSNRARLELTNAMKAKFKGHGLIDKTQIAAVAPKYWKKCMQIGVGALDRLGNGTLRMSDRNLLISGSTRDEDVANSLAGDVRAATVRRCESDVRVDFITPPEPNLVWSATWADGVIVLDGDVPDAQTKTELVRSAKKRYPKARIVDRMKVVGGYAKNWRKVALSGLAMLASLRQGKSILDAQKLSVRGEARDTPSASAIKARLQQNLPPLYNGRSSITVRSDAMIWAEKEAKRKAALQKKRAAEALRMAALEKERQRIEDEKRRERDLRARQEEEARRAEREARRRKRDAERRALKAEKRAAERLAAERRAQEAERQAIETRRLNAAAAARASDDARTRAEEIRRAEAQTRRREDEIRRRAERDERRRAEEAARRAEARAEAEAEAQAERRAAQTAEEKRRRQQIALQNQERGRVEREARRIACQDSIRDVARQGVIRFRSAKASLSKSSYPTLEQLAEAALICRDLSIDIAGHTDSDGTATRNKKLSQRRANAVRDYLISAGVSADRLRAVGYGEERPLVKNDSKKNKARNRRIEFNVRAN